MPLATAKLDSLRRTGDLAGVVDFFKGSNPAERRALEKAALAAERAARRGSDTDYDTWDREAWEASRLTVLACAAWPALKRIHWEIGGPHFRDAEWSEWWRQAVRLIELIKPAWVDDWAELLLRQNLDHWFFVRELVRQKLCRTPACDHYTHGLMRTMHWRFHTYVAKKRGGGAQSKFATVADALLDDPDLLRHDVWRLFEVEGTSKCNLQSLEPTQGTNWIAKTKIPAEVEKYSWRHALVQLAARRKLPRARLLDASLAALTRDFEPHHAGWFFRLHDALQPTTAERTERRAHYLALLASPHSNISAWALQTVTELDRISPIPAAELLKNFAPALGGKSKGGAKAAVQLIGRALAREPKERLKLLRLATGALAGEVADVQLAVFKLLDEHGDKTDAVLRACLRERAGSVVPTLRARLTEWTGPAGRAGKSRAAATPPASPKVAPAPAARSVARLDRARRIAPIETFDELLECADRALDNRASVEDIERVLDGLLRLGAGKPADFTARTEPLRRRILAAGWPHLAKRSDLSASDVLEGSHPQALMSSARLLATVMESWRVGKIVFPRLAEAEALNQTFRFLYHRLKGIALLVHRGVSLPLLSAPTHRGGWIEPGALVARMRRWEKSGQAGDPHDFCLALLRLAPEGREAALAEAKSLAAGEAVDALRHALGDDVTVGPTAAVWVAAARARAPFLDDAAVERRHPGLGADAGCAGRLDWFTERTVELFKNPMESAVAEMIGVKPSPDRAFTLDLLSLTVKPGLPTNLSLTPLPVLLHGPWEGDGLSYREEAGLLRWSFTLWPASPEPIFGALALWWMAATHSFIYREGYRHVFLEIAFEVLNDPHTRVGPMGSLLHALALLSPEAECRALASRTLAAHIAANRFSASALGTTLSRLLGTMIGKAARLTPALAEVTRVSPLHATAVQSLIEEALAGDPAKAPNDLAKLLELFVELVSASGHPLAHSGAREYLARLPRSGRTAKLVAQLLARPKRG